MEEAAIFVLLTQSTIEQLLEVFENNNNNHILGEILRKKIFESQMQFLMELMNSSALIP